MTLAESQGKKAGFLREAVRTLGLPSMVHSGRAETLATRFDCVTLRAVDRMGEAVRAASGLVSPGGCLVLMTTEAELEEQKSYSTTHLIWGEPRELAGSLQGVVAIGRVGNAG